MTWAEKALETLNSITEEQYRDTPWWDDIVSRLAGVDLDASEQIDVFYRSCQVALKNFFSSAVFWPTMCIRTTFVRNEGGAGMNRDQFAQRLGFSDYDELLYVSELVASEGDVYWWVTPLPDGRWAAWDDAELSPDRVCCFSTEEDAVAYQELSLLEKRGAFF